MRERRFAFVLRLWIEHSDLNDAPVLPLRCASGTGVRGSLQAAGAEQVRYFTSLDDIPDLVRELTGWRSAMHSNRADIDID